MTNLNNYAITLNGKILTFAPTREAARAFKASVKKSFHLGHNDSSLKIFKLSATQEVR